MCGIAGYLGSLDRDVARERADAMARALAHRGPDGHGVETFDVGGGVTLALAHRRLSILDLSPAGRQPMTFAESGLWITFNGEIYNFVELREELEAMGHRFRTGTDTEVALAAIREWGDAAYRRFNGMWALAVYDSAARRLTLCRDRFGVKPLYYKLVPGGLAFASECKAFWAIADALALRWDPRGIRTAIEDPFALERSGHTLLDGVEPLPAGHVLHVDARGARHSRWWRTLDELGPVPARLDEQAARFRELFLDACRVRMRSDVPIGTSLSGGLDSSSVVAALAHLSAQGGRADRAPTDWRKTFVHRFPGTSQDETSFAQVAARAVGLEPIYVDAREDVAGHFDEALVSLEGIFAGTPDGQWRVYREQRRHGVVVTLDGHGADELLGGYEFTVAATMDTLPLLSRRFWELRRIRVKILGTSYEGRLRELAGAVGRRRSVRHLTKTLGIRGALRTPFVERSFLSDDLGAVGSYAVPLAEPTPGLEPLNAILYETFHHTTLPRLLLNYDLTSMAHGVEIRMPFMDHRLVTYAFSLPQTAKLGRGFTKLVLREALRGILTEKIRTRRTKIGFNSPIAEWLRGPLQPWVRTVLASGGTGADFVDVGRMRAFYEQKVLPGRATWGGTVELWKALNAMRLTQLARTVGA